MTRGTLQFYSETGSEGGWYAWQDERFVHSGTIGQPCPWGSQHCPVTLGHWHEHASYEGLHRLRNGDYLRVFDSDGGVTWDGTVTLRLRDDVYTNPEATVYGLWVNQEPDGVDRQRWASMFFAGQACEVTPKPVEP